jgi:hypothetical protein
MDTLFVKIRTADKAHKAEVDMDPTTPLSELLEIARENWGLDSKYEYIIRHVEKGEQLNLSQTLKDAGFETGQTLEIQPLSEAGAL